MDYFCALPGEIKDIIVSFLADREKRLLRSTNTEWFNKINYSHFTIYFAKSSMLPDIIETFQRYSKPIGLCFQKSRELSHSYVTLTTLSNLTRLEIDPDRFASPQFMRLTFADLLQFSSLTNLQHFSYAVLGNIQLPKHYPHLTYLSTRVLKPNERQEHINYLRNLTGLQTLRFFAVSKLESDDIFDLLGNPGALKSLDLIGDPVQWKNTESVSKVSNLTSLSIGTTQFMFPFSKLPKLESLKISFADQLDDFSTSTNLTHLYVTAPRVTHNYRQLAALKNLISLTLTTNIDEDQYSFLGELTNLECLTLRDGKTHSNVLQFIQSSKLTQLSMHSTKIMLNTLTHLTNLEAIEGWSFHEPTVTPLTNVTRLWTRHILEGYECLPNVKHLEIYDTLQNYQYVTSLQHLESLTVRFVSTELHLLLGNMTNLTTLNAFYSAGQIFDFNILRSLIALKVLKLQSKNDERVTICDGLPRALAAMTNLESLYTFGVPNDELVYAISGLSKLTCLCLEDQEASSIDELKFSTLTNLQHLKLTSHGRLQPSYKLDLPYLYDFER